MALDMGNDSKIGNAHVTNKRISLLLYAFFRPNIISQSLTWVLAIIVWHWVCGYTVDTTQLRVASRTDVATAFHQCLSVGVSSVMLQ